MCGLDIFCIYVCMYDDVWISGWAPDVSGWAIWMLPDEPRTSHGVECAALKIWYEPIWTKIGKITDTKYLKEKFSFPRPWLVRDQHFPDEPRTTRTTPGRVPDEFRMSQPGVILGREPDVLNILIHPSPDRPSINPDHPGPPGCTKDDPG